MAKKQKYNGYLMATLLKAKRTVDKKNNILISLRDASKQSGISFATLSRMENGKCPDVNTLIKASYWLGKPIEAFFKSSK